MPRLGMGELIVFLLLGIIFIYPLWKIPKKAGYSSAVSLLFFLVMFVPLLNIVALWVFASAEWPVLKELKSKSEGALPPPSVSRTTFRT